MLKKFIKNFRDSAKMGMFKNHFIGQIIQDKEDKESFYIYYQDKVTSIVLSCLLDLDFTAEGNEFKVTSPITGNHSTLSFYFAPPFIEEDNQKNIEDDVNNLTKFEDFLIAEIKAKFPNAPNFESYFEAVYYVVSFLLNESNSKDHFKVQKLGELLTCSKNRLYFARPETTCADQDMIMASAWKSIHYISRIAGLPEHTIRRFTAQDYISNINDILEAEFNLPLEQRNYERVEAYKYSDDERRTKKSGFWEYKKICDNFAKNPEMW